MILEIDHIYTKFNSSFLRSCPPNNYIVSRQYVLVMTQKNVILLKKKIISEHFNSELFSSASVQNTNEHVHWKSPRLKAPWCSYNSGVFFFQNLTFVPLSPLSSQFYCLLFSALKGAGGKFDSHYVTEINTEFPNWKYQNKNALSME